MIKYGHYNGGAKVNFHLTLIKSQKNKRSVIRDKYFIIFLPGILFAPSCRQATSNENTNEDNKNEPFAIVPPKPQVYKWLSFDEIKPKIWLTYQLNHNLKGFGTFKAVD